MEVCSLEDDDYNGLFITQSDPVRSSNDASVKILPDGSDFSSPCVSLMLHTTASQSQYEDISDNEIFDIPSSQANRYVNELV